MRTNAGRDWQARIMGDPLSSGSGAFAPACWMGVSTNGVAPAATDVMLAGEVLVGTLARAQGVFAHTTGTATYTVSRNVQADQAVTLRKAGLFNAPTGGTLCFEELLSAEAPLQNGDSITITMTVQI